MDLGPFRFGGLGLKVWGLEVTYANVPRTLNLKPQNVQVESYEMGFYKGFYTPGS